MYSNHICGNGKGLYIEGYMEGYKKKQDTRWNKFSVLMSLYIGEKAEYFDVCLKSMLRQTVRPTEIVIVRDGPITDEVAQVLQKYRKKYPEIFHIISLKTNHGLGYALAEGVKACKYELIARMDTDDIARKDRFEKQLAEFNKDPELDICGSSIYEFEGEVSNIVAKRTVPLTDKKIKHYQKRRDALNHVTVMFKKSAVLRAGNYQSCLLMEDSLLWVHMMQNGAKCKNREEPLVYVRIGKDMYSRRGGFSYFLKYKNGRKRILETGYISQWDYYYTLIVQFFVALVPGRIRGWIFKNLLHH